MINNDNVNDNDIDTIAIHLMFDREHHKVRAMLWSSCLVTKKKVNLSHSHLTSYWKLSGKNPFFSLCVYPFGTALFHQFQLSV